MKYWLIGLAGLCLLGLSCRFFIAQDQSSPVNFDPALYGQVQNNIPYCTLDDKPQMMDIYYPKKGGPWPVILHVHGGGWTEGDKSEAADSRGWTEQGYLLVSINYRMYPEDTFPAMIEDVKCAVRSLRAHASEYNLDPRRIVAMGGSAGGHLVALLGVTDESAGWDVGEYLDQSSRVQAVIVMAGPADLTGTYPEWVTTLISNVFPGEGASQSGSPVSYITPDDPPFLILHGDRDDVVPVEQGRLLHERLLANNVSSQLVIVEHGDHSLNAPDGSASPNWAELASIMMEFLSENLR
jgi:acetyl esterase/lipase